MDCEGKSSSTLTDEQEAMEAVVNYLLKEIDEIVELEDCATQGVNECIVAKSFPCGLNLFEDLQIKRWSYLTYKDQTW